MFSCAKSIAGLAVMLAVTNGFAGSAKGQFAVKITLNSSNNSCTSASDSGAGSASVQVKCTANVFVDIAQDNRFMPGFRPARDSLLPDYCRNEQMGLAGQMARIACRLDDAQGSLAYADDEADDGWKIESRLYAVDTEAAPAEALARRHLQDQQGTLTALRVAYAEGHFGPVEMLISF